MKILIIDDSKDFRALVRLYLAKALEWAELVEYAVEDIGKPADDYQWSDYDVLLLDYNLGGGEDGFDWLKEFKHKPGFPPTIILTAEGDEYIAVTAIKLGAADYLNKVDITPKRLADVIKEAVEFTSENIATQEGEISNAAKIVEIIHQKDKELPTDKDFSSGYKICSNDRSGGHVQGLSCRA